MEPYFIPTGAGEAEFTEKRSSFLGHVRPVETEEAAKEFIAAMKKQYHDARHNCWCYRIQGGPERYSDDGEPQGSAGIPMLEVFKRAEVTNVVCVVTRYFGGVLLGTGGLLRAYTKSAKDALDAAGISAVRRWVGCGNKYHSLCTGSTGAGGRRGGGTGLRRGRGASRPAAGGTSGDVPRAAERSFRGQRRGEGRRPGAQSGTNGGNLR